MSFLTTFEVITLVSVGLSLLAIAGFEINDTIIDRKRNVIRKPVFQPARRVAMAKAETSAIAANQLVDLPKAA